VGHTARGPHRGRYEAALLESNFEMLLSNVSEKVAEQLERAVQKTPFNQLGGVLLDADVRSITTFLSSLTMFSCRDKFVRLSQVLVLLCLETVAEVAECVFARARVCV
jgi:hypothetical protein